MPPFSAHTTSLTRATLRLVLVVSAAHALPRAVHAQPVCTQAQIEAAMEQGTRKLKAINSASAPLLQTRLRALQKAKGWRDDEADERGYAFVEDEKISAIDRETNTLVSRMDELSEERPDLPNCERLLELRQTLDRLGELAAQKSRLLQTKLDSALAAGAAETAAAAQPAPDAGRAGAAPQPGSKTSTIAPRHETQQEPRGSKPEAPPAWSTETRADPSSRAAAQENAPPAQSPPTALTPSAATQPVPGLSASTLPPMLPGLTAAERTYSVKEISLAGSGFFGQISTGLASVIDYAFQKIGQPTGYVLGDEGGGAFLAGIRYGKGQLFMKGREPQTVYWRGPSAGFDFGAEASKIMYLAYNLKAPDDMFTNFGGIDGSAYLVGGVGIKFLTNGKLVLAPIRSGLGLRLGANVGYIRFSPTQSWVPF